MLRVDYKKELGNIQLTDGNTIYIYECNALAALCLKENNNMTLWSFFADIGHAKNCLGITKGYEDIFRGIIFSIKLNIKNSNMYQLAKIFAQAGYKTEIYYE